MAVLTLATYKALLVNMLEIGVANSWDNLPDCTGGWPGHDWQLRENVTTTVDFGYGVVTRTFPWAIQCSNCEFACCIQYDWVRE